MSAQWLIKSVCNIGSYAPSAAAACTSYIGCLTADAAASNTNSKRSNA